MTSDVEPQGHRYSIARFFVEDRHVSWVLLVGVIGWGMWAYGAMPKRKDPDIPVRQVAVVTPWPARSGWSNSSREKSRNASRRISACPRSHQHHGPDSRWSTPRSTSRRRLIPR